MYCYYYSFIVTFSITENVFMWERSSSDDPGYIFKEATQSQKNANK